MNIKKMGHKLVLVALVSGLAASPAGYALAQSSAAPIPSLLQNQSWAELVERAFLRTASGASADAAQASAQAGSALAGRRYPGTLEADGALRQDIIGSNKGYREAEAGVTASLWRRGERDGLRAQSAGYAALANRQREAAKLDVAGQVRAAWWAFEAARAEVGVLEDQVRFAGEVVATTSRLVEAGEMAQLDLLQAGAAQAQLQARLATAQGQAAVARAALTALVGETTASLPIESVGALDVDTHPDILVLRAEAETLESQARLVRLQAGPAWRVGLDVRAERGLTGENTITSTGVRVARPFGASPTGNIEASGLQARATAILLQVAARKLAIEGTRNQAIARLTAARAAQTSALAQRDAASQALVLTLRGRGEGELSFFEELRARALLADAQRSFALAGVEIGAAISAFNQAQGLLP